MNGNTIIKACMIAAGLATGWPGIHQAEAQITLNPIGSYASGVFDEGAAEIVTFDPTSQHLYVSNADANTIDVLDASDPTDPALSFTIDLSPYGDGVNCVAFHDGVLAAAVEADPKQDPGAVVFLEPDGALITVVTVGALPDMLAFTPDGTKVVVANEGEPNDDYNVDPEGSVSIIDISGGVSGVTQADVATASFLPYNGLVRRMRRANIRIFGPGATVAQDIEPEYLAFSADSSKAYVTLQENNAFAVVDLDTATVESVKSFGTKSHRNPHNGLDVSNEDGAINIATWPVKGLYLPDGIATYEVAGATFLVTANEGDSRDYDGFSEEERVKDLALGNGLLNAYPGLQEDENLGRLKVTIAGLTGTRLKNGKTVFDQLYSFGARSFSIWNASGELVFDSGDDFERITAEAIPDHFNASNDDNEFDDRSDDKGPEPEGVVIGEIGGRQYAFIGLERVGGIMVYDVTSPYAPFFVEYVNNRDFAEDPESGAAGDLGPEGLLFIPAALSPNGQDLLVVANEVSGTTTIYEISQN